jgi:ADP-heptose:LPS heptosyltransferase
MAQLFIGHSTGPLQVAYMAGIPTVSLWGASSPLIWGTELDSEKDICIRADLECIGCEKIVCPKGTLKCMEQISVDMVIKEVEKLFKMMV